jgi:hypothetical protein
MQEHVLINPDIFPDEKVIAKHLGATSHKLYQKVLGYTQDVIPDVEQVWNYYRDGKSWLLRLMKKSKTFYWIAVYKGSFRVTFYLSSSSEKKIAACDIPEELKQEYEETKSRQVRWISVPMAKKEDFEVFKTLLQIKANLK